MLCLMACQRASRTLPIPFQAVATDFFTQREYVVSSGPLLSAVAASSALPALLTPVKLGGRVLIDGGFVNPLPFDLVAPHTDFVIAVDVSGGPVEFEGRVSAPA